MTDAKKIKQEDSVESRQHIDLYDIEIANWDAADSNRDWIANNVVALPTGHNGKAQHRIVRAPAHVVSACRANQYESRADFAIESIFVIKLRTMRKDGTKTRRVYTLGITAQDSNENRRIFELSGGYDLPRDKAGNYVVADVNLHNKYINLLCDGIADSDIHDALHFSNHLGRAKTAASVRRFQVESLDSVKSQKLGF